MLYFNLDSASPQLKIRHAGVLEGLTTGGGGIEVVGDLTVADISTTSGYRTMLGALQTHQDITVVLGGDTIVVGAYKALKESGKLADDEQLTCCSAQPPYRRPSLQPMKLEHVPGGVVHVLPDDLRVALQGTTDALAAWQDITPLARNEFICWVENAKQATTRERRVRRTLEELQEGMRRPCCWPGCSHRERTGR